MRLFFHAALCVAIGFSVVVAMEKAIGVQALPFTMRDQFNNTWSWEKNFKGKPVVMVLSDWKGSDYTANWTRPLVEKYSSNAQFVAFADVSLAPDFIRSYIQERFREEYSTPVLLDWNGIIFQHYKVQPGLPNVVFIDPQGTVKLHTWGTGKKEHVEKVIKAIASYISPGQ
jgi:hypothetical protein